MKIVVPILVAACLAGCAARGAPEVGRWCGADPPGAGLAVDLPEVRFSHIRESRVRMAQRMVARKSLVAISSRRFADMARDPADLPVGTHFYVARAGIMLPSESGNDEVRRLAGRFDVLFSRNQGPDVLNIVSVVTSYDPLSPVDRPILVAAPHRFREARVRCLAAR